MLKCPLSKRQQITNVGEDVEKREPLGTIGGNVNWCSHYGKLPPKLKIELPYHLAMPLLCIFLKKAKTLIEKDMRTPMFIAALFTIAKIRKQPMCPLIDGWIKKMFI